MKRFELLKKDGAARRGVFHTVHGDIQTPVFMNVGTSAAIKGAVSTADLEEIKCQVELSNTYHLHVRPGEDVIYRLGGLHKFFRWDKPILTDSGGFQVFSLAHLRNIREDGVTFQSHMDGTRIYMSPEISMQIQSRLGSTIAMAFDECPSSVAEHGYIERSCERTARWLVRCREEIERLNALPGTVNPNQILFGINQGGVYPDIRKRHMEQIRALDLEGYAIGGLAVGETADVMYQIIEEVEPFMPADKPRYLMGVGTPVNILECVDRGVDFFDCVMPSRNARHGNLFTSEGLLNLHNNKFAEDPRPLDEQCDCPVCRRYSRAYVRHLFKAREMLAMRLCVLHNLYFYNTLTEQIRASIEDGTWKSFKEEKVAAFSKRV